MPRLSDYIEGLAIFASVAGIVLAVVAVLG
jgi:hypothetical protein